MEVSDAISGKGTAFLANTIAMPTTPVAETSMTTSSSGKRSTATTGTDGEGGNFSDEGLSTVRRVVQPKETEFPSGPGTSSNSSFAVAQVGVRKILENIWFTILNKVFLCNNSRLSYLTIFPGR